MPFLTDDDRPLDELLLAQRPDDGHRFQVRAPFAYLDPVGGQRYEVPVQDAASSPGDAGDGAAGSDLASVPSALWGLIASYGRQSAPALLHDHRSAVAAGSATGGPPSRSAASTTGCSARRSASRGCRC
ncbi:DUF1353 domain-containing protein [Agromyces laixinhei]|uniref:DUF1353 domain-containing protein n=1 Tax=Agromyces laixinhei TaxID=2585717 RepID=UPI00143D1190|nr:DUF1353 domain-containing protein [Agromyces laixinhei]